MTKREIKITVERERIIEITRGRKKIERWCSQCGEQALMLTTEQAALVTGVSQRAINRQVEEGHIHFDETSEGLLLICLQSLID